MDADKLFGVGSYLQIGEWASPFDICVIDKGTDEVPGINFRW